MGRAPAADDVTRVREWFQLFLEPELLDPAICAKDARALADLWARGRSGGCSRSTWPR